MSSRTCGMRSHMRRIGTRPPGISPYTTSCRSPCRHATVFTGLHNAWFDVARKRAACDRTKYPTKCHSMYIVHFTVYLSAASDVELEAFLKSSIPCPMPSPFINDVDRKRRQSSNDRPFKCDLSKNISAQNGP